MGVGDEALTEPTDAGTGGLPQVSVIIPVRNRADLLGATLGALAAQRLTDHEVIVVDDGSTDGSAEVARSHAEGDPRVRLVAAHASGAVAARTQGVREARAAVLAFTDSDCVPDPRWLEVGVGAIMAGADVVQGRTEPERAVRPLERSVWSMRDDGLFATCNVFYRRSAFDAAGGFDGHAGDRLGFRPGSKLRGYGFGEDTLIGWRVRRRGVAVYEDSAIVHHAVLPHEPRDALSRAWTMGAFPGLLHEVPELRDLMAGDLRDGLRRRSPLYVMLVGAVLRQRGLAALGLLIWVVGRWRELCDSEPSVRRRLVVLPMIFTIDVTQTVALAWGSARSRTLVL